MDDERPAEGRKRSRGADGEEASRKRLVPELSHMGMARQSDAGAASKGSAIAQLSVADQEALALSMLSRRR